MKRFASIGLGWVAREIWLPIFYEHPDFEVIGAFDPDNQSVDQTLKRHPRTKVFDGIDDIIEHKPAIVLIAVPNRYHAAIAELLLKNGISVLIEKPICLKINEIDRLKEAAFCGGSHIFVSKASRLRADVRIMQQYIDDGILGTLRFIELAWIRASGIPRPGSWFTNSFMSGGGVSVDLGWHMLDVGLSLLEYPEVTKMISFKSYDHINNEERRKAVWRNDVTNSDALTIDVEDTAVAFLATEGNVVLQLHVAWASHNPYDYTQIVAHGSEGKMELMTTFGFSTNRIPTPSLTLRQNGKHIALDIPDTALITPYYNQAMEVSQQLDIQPDNTQCLKNISSIVRVLETLGTA